MANIFENAYFGKFYRTRDGHKAIYIYKEALYPFRHALSLGGVVNAMYKENGLYDMKEKVDNYHADIVSEWQETFDNAELDRLAEDESYKFPIPADWCQEYCYEEGYKAGYRKAIENGKF